MECCEIVSEQTGKEDAEEIICMVLECKNPQAASIPKAIKESKLLWDWRKCSLMTLQDREIKGRL